MREVGFALPGICLTILSWGFYGAVLHKGQHELGNDRLKPLICVGLAYFIVAIIVPTLVLAFSGKLRGDWSTSGISWSMAAGVAGACGAFGIILAMTLGTKFGVRGGSPIYVMPLVFGGAPVINVLAATLFAKLDGKSFQWNPVFFVGMVMVIAGAALVLIYKPAPKGPPPAHAQSAVEEPTASAQPLPSKGT